MARDWNKILNAEPATQQTGVRDWNKIIPSASVTPAPQPKEVKPLKIWEPQRDKEKDKKYILSPASSKLEAPKVEEKKQLSMTRLKTAIQEQDRETLEKEFGLNPDFAIKYPQLTQGVKNVTDLVNAPIKFLENKLPVLQRIREVGANRQLMSDDITPVDTGSKIGNVVGDIAGTIAGYAMPLPGNQLSLLQGANQLSQPVAQKVTEKLGTGLGGRLATGFAREATEGAVLGTLEGLARDEKGKTLAKRVASETLIGGALGAAFEGVAKVVGDAIQKGKLEKINATSILEQPKIDAPNINKPSGSYKVKNNALESAINEYNNAIEVIQNHFQTNQLRADEIGRIKTELNIDLDDIVSKIQKAEASSLTDIGNKKQLGIKAGVIEPPKLKPLGQESTESILKPLNSLGDTKPLPPTKKALTEATEALTEVAATKTEVDLLENSANWKDKNRFSYKRETMIRNFEDIMGADAPKMKETYLEPIGKAEADRIRFLNTERKAISDLGIKPRSSESALVQKFGEGLIDEATLRAQTKDADKIINAANFIRNKYDDYLDKINEALVKNDYDPIPKRKDYMRHFTEVSGFLEKYGIPTKEYKLPTDLNGMTANLKPGKNFFASALRRTSNITDYDAIQGIDKYLDGASKVMYHTDNIQRLRGLDKTLRETFKGTDHLSNFAAELTDYTNLLAGKKALIDRGVEDTFGRTAYGVLDKLKKQTGANMVGMNIASATTNFIPLTQSLATTDKDSFVKGMYDTIANIWKNDDFVNQSDFLTRRVGSDPLSISNWDNIGKKSGFLFEAIDKFVSQTIVRGKYYEGIKNGIDPAKAIKAADEYAAKVIADRSLASMPTLFSSKALGAFTQFQLEVNNQLSFLMKDIPRDAQRATASAVAQLFVYSYIFNNIFEKATGRRPALDPIGIAQQAYEDYNNENLKTTDATKNLVNNVKDNLPFVSVLTGGRIPLSSAIPNPLDVATGESTGKKELAKLGYLLSPTGYGQATKTVKGATALGLNPLQKQELPGVYGTPASGNKYLKYPVEKNKTNIARGLLLGPSGFKETAPFYDNKVKSLTAEQTKKLEDAAKKGKDPLPLYNKLLEVRKLNKEIDKIKEDTTLTGLQKDQKIKKLRFEIKKLERN